MKVLCDLNKCIYNKEGACSQSELDLMDGVCVDYTLKEELDETLPLTEEERITRVRTLQEELNTLKKECKHPNVTHSFAVKEDGYCSACDSILYNYFIPDPFENWSTNVDLVECPLCDKLVESLWEVKCIDGTILACFDCKKERILK